MMVSDWDELTKLDSISYVYLNKDSLVGLLPHRSLPKADNLCHTLTVGENEYSNSIELRGRFSVVQC